MVGQRRLMAAGAERAIPSILYLCGAGALVYGCGYLGVAGSPVFPVAVVFAFLAHLGGGAQWTLSNLGLQLATSDAFRGRIFAADFALLTLTMSSSFLISGWVTAPFGPRLVTVVLAVIAGSWGVLYLGVTRTLRRPTAIDSA